jgi:hypothetical protein
LGGKGFWQDARKGDFRTVILSASEESNTGLAAGYALDSSAAPQNDKQCDPEPLAQPVVRADDVRRAGLQKQVAVSSMAL